MGPPVGYPLRYDAAVPAPPTPPNIPPEPAAPVPPATPLAAAAALRWPLLEDDDSIAASLPGVGSEVPARLAPAQPSAIGGEADGPTQPAATTLTLGGESGGDRPGGNGGFAAAADAYPNAKA